MMKGTYKCLGQVPPALNSKDLIFIRHGESIAEVFPDWVFLSKLEENYYIPFDLNVPIKIPKRPQMKKAYALDSPLSEAGIIKAQILARELIDRKAGRISVIYCSPTLVSLQTAGAIQQFLGNRIGPIRIEPALCTDQEGKDFWMTASQLESEYSFDNTYNPQIDEVSELSLDAMRSRVLSFIRKIQKEANQIDGIALFVTDSLGMKIIADDARSLDTLDHCQSLQEVYGVSAYAFPPSSSLVVIYDAKNKKLMKSTGNLRKLTNIGQTTAQNFDVDFPFVK